MREDAVEVLFVIGIKNITKQKTDKGISSTLIALGYIEDNELNQFSCLDWQDLILKNQQHLPDNTTILIKSVKIGE